MDQAPARLQAVDRHQETPAAPYPGLLVPDYSPVAEPVGRATILVVDHVDINRQLLKGMLKAGPYRLLEAKQPVDALAILEATCGLLALRADAPQAQPWRGLHHHLDVLAERAGELGLPDARLTLVGEPATTDALAARLQEEGAKAFVKSWNELLDGLARKTGAGSMWTSS